MLSALTVAPAPVVVETALGVRGTDCLLRSVHAARLPATLAPGKVDALYVGNRDTSAYNAFLWTPVVKGGAGLVSAGLPSGQSAGQRTWQRYAGGYLRVTYGETTCGELVVGAFHLDRGASRGTEWQAEYRTASGVALGGGAWVARGSGDARFVKASYRALGPQRGYIVTAQAQSLDGMWRPGVWMAVLRHGWFGAAGLDGEQVRVTGAYVRPRARGRVREAAEVVYVDNAVGAHPGPRVLFANMTLGFEGGFLDTPARLGRAMGPTGLEFGNPLGYARPTWNRRLEPWEMGGLADVRVDWARLPNGASIARYDGIIFPLQLDGALGPLDRVLFLGGFVRREPGLDSQIGRAHV